jgi:hypothetical protein
MLPRARVVAPAFPSELEYGSVFGPGKGKGREGSKTLAKREA